MLTSPTKVVLEDQWLRSNIFRTRCTAKGKLCNMIIDSGSSENIVSKEMVTINKAIHFIIPLHLLSLRRLARQVNISELKMAPPPVSPLSLAIIKGVGVVYNGYNGYNGAGSS